MDFKTHFAIETLINDNYEGRSPLLTVHSDSDV